MNKTTRAATNNTAGRSAARGQRVAHVWHKYSLSS